MKTEKTFANGDKVTINDFVGIINQSEMTREEKIQTIMQEYETTEVEAKKVYNDYFGYEAIK